jgi:asparagine synthase (glutamine-hydrolysing)
MCGIYGGFRPLLTNNPTNSLMHRGPDDSGEVIITDNYLMGATRLAIVTETSVSTPYISTRAVLCFNGEVYNYRELSEKHKSLFAATPNSDTEVVCKLLEEYGEGIISKFEGFFALAFYDKASRDLVLARDRSGKKPLFFVTDSDSNIAFASEIKALKGARYLNNPICDELEFYFDELTPYEGIEQIQPGCLLKVNINGVRKKIKNERWYRYPDYNPISRNLDDAAEEFVELLRQSILMRSRAAVPIAVALSGGVDSQLIMALSGIEFAYTVQFREYKESIDEWSLVKSIKNDRGKQIRQVTPRKKDFIRKFKKLAYHLEYPVGSLSVFPLFELYRVASSDGIKVMISGEGSDELFNGYFRHEFLLREENHIIGLEGEAYSTLIKKYYGSDLERFCRMARRTRPLSAELISRISRVWDNTAPFHYNLSKVDFCIFLQPLLMMADRMSMANSIEV